MHFSQVHKRSQQAGDEAFADGPSAVEIRIDDLATPMHSFERRIREGAD